MCLSLVCQPQPQIYNFQQRILCCAAIALFPSITAPHPDEAGGLFL
jgi:hypothetical protein